MNPEQLATYLGVSMPQLAQRMIQEAVGLSKVIIPREEYSRNELDQLAEAINIVLFDQQYGNKEGKTYERFLAGSFRRTKVTNRLCAYILHKQGKIIYEPSPNEPRDAYWLEYCDSMLGQQTEVAAQEPITPQQVRATRKYHAYFFSHIRYNVWDEGAIEMSYLTEHSGVVSGRGFYRGIDDTFEGTFEIKGNYICMDLQGSTKPNWFRLIGKVDGDKMKNTPYFRAAYVTISSYTQQNISAIEVIFLEETFAIRNPLEVLKVKRYLMLQRHRFQSSSLTPSEHLTVLPSGLRPNNIERIIGSYVCVSRIHDQILVSTLLIDEIYRTTFKTKVYQKSGNDKNYQLCYLELIPTGAPDYIHIKGYKATENTDEPTLEHLFSTLTIPITISDATPIRGTFNSLVELNGQEIIWAGDCYLIKVNNIEKIDPFMCPVEEFEYYLNDNKNIMHDKILNVLMK